MVAKFIGKNNSLGLRNGQKYNVESLILLGIWLAIDGELCLYSSLEKVLENWEFETGKTGSSSTPRVQKLICDVDNFEEYYCLEQLECDENCIFFVDNPNFGCLIREFVDALRELEE